MSREQIALGLERLLLVQELVASVSQEFARLESQNTDYRLKMNLASNSPVPMTPTGSKPERSLEPVMRNVRSVFPDQGLIDDYSEMAVKYGNLRREMAIMRANIESVLRHLDDFWTEDKESKAVIVEQLRKALVTNADS